MFERIFDPDSMLIGIRCAETGSHRSRRHFRAETVDLACHLRHSLVNTVFRVGDFSGDLDRHFDLGMKRGLRSHG
jgi:hypothetical protein